MITLIVVLLTIFFIMASICPLLVTEDVQHIVKGARWIKKS